MSTNKLTAELGLGEITERQELIKNYDGQEVVESHNRGDSVHKEYVDLKDAACLGVEISISALYGCHFSTVTP